VKTVESWKTQVDNSNIGSLTVGSDRWEEAAAQVPNRRGKTERTETITTTVRRRSTEQEMADVLEELFDAGRWLQ
jgi:hypothetical protein